MRLTKMHLPKSCALVALVGLTSLTACKDETPTAAPAPEGSAAPAANSAAVVSRPNPAPKVDPLVLKSYRTDICYFGTQSLLQARDAYLASLGGAEPGPGKVPVLEPKEEKTPEEVGDAKDPKDLSRKRALAQRRRASMRAPHERNARSCSVAAGLKSPAAPQVDTVLAEYAPYAIKLAKALTATNAYYQRGQHEKDNFAEGKKFHKVLLEQFETLDEHYKKLGDAVAAWRADAPPPVDTVPPVKDSGDDAAKPEVLAKQAEARKLGNAAVEEARLVMLELAAEKPDAAKVTEALAKVKEATEALRKYGEAEKEDPWSKILTAPLDAFIQEVGDAAAADKLRDAAAWVGIINVSTRLIESRHRALTRSLLSHGRTFDPSKLRPRLPMGHPRMPGPKRGGATAPPAEQEE